MHLHSISKMAGNATNLSILWLFDGVNFAEKKINSIWCHFSVIYFWAAKYGKLNKYLKTGSLCNLIKVSSMQIYVIILVLGVLKLEKRIDISHTFVYLSIFYHTLPPWSPNSTHYTKIKIAFETTLIQHINWKVHSLKFYIKIMIKLARKFVNFRNFPSILFNLLP